MADVLNRATKQYLRSVNTPDYPLIDWIIEPDMSAVTGYANKYWVITGDIVSLMSLTERDAVDAAELSSERDDKADWIDKSETYTRAMALVVLDEINILRNQHGLSLRTIPQMKTALRAKMDT